MLLIFGLVVGLGILAAAPTLLPRPGTRRCGTGLVRPGPWCRATRVSPGCDEHGNASP
jgi:hypothetical protein